MSEYQYYRFACLDGHLESKQREELRRISSRAEINATSFQVYYQYGDLKAKTSDLMLKYFDIGFYYANWGSIDTYIKLPAGTIPEVFLQLDDHGFDVYETDQWQLLLFSMEEYDDYFDDENADDFFQHLSALRTELLQGDLRLLYFIWIKAFDSNDDIAAIPLMSYDFNQLSEAQIAFANLFSIPFSLIRALTLILKNKPSHRTESNCLHVDDWLHQLTETEKNQLLTTLFVQGQLSRHQALAMTSKARANEQVGYQHWLSAQAIKPYIDIGKTQLQQEQTIALAKRMATEKAEKEAKLSEVYNQRELIWQHAEEQANRACANGYEQASHDLHQLAGSYQFKGVYSSFDSSFKHFISKHSSKKALLRRLQDLMTFSAADH